MSGGWRAGGREARAGGQRPAELQPSSHQRHCSSCTSALRGPSPTPVAVDATAPSTMRDDAALPSPLFHACRVCALPLAAREYAKQGEDKLHARLVSVASPCGVPSRCARCVRATVRDDSSTLHHFPFRLFRLCLVRPGTRARVMSAPPVLFGLFVCLCVCVCVCPSPDLFFFRGGFPRPMSCSCSSHAYTLPWRGVRHATQRRVRPRVCVHVCMRQTPHARPALLFSFALLRCSFLVLMMSISVLLHVCPACPRVVNHLSA